MFPILLQFFQGIFETYLSYVFQFQSQSNFITQLSMCMSFTGIGLEFSHYTATTQPKKKNTQTYFYSTVMLPSATTLVITVPLHPRAIHSSFQEFLMILIIRAIS